MKYYYLHIHAANIYEDKKKSDSVCIDSVLTDPIVQANGFWGTTKLSQHLLKNKELKIEFKKISNIKYGDSLYHNSNVDIQNLPTFLYKLLFNGVPGKDDIGVYANSNLVVSEYGLNLLRKEGVKRAESDLITGSIEAYFANNQHYFWMPEPFRSKFIDRFVNEKK